MSPRRKHNERVPDVVAKHLGARASLIPFNPLRVWEVKDEVSGLGKRLTSGTHEFHARTQREGASAADRDQKEAVFRTDKSPASRTGEGLAVNREGLKTSGAARSK
jgi:hypothetical protein